MLASSADSMSRVFTLSMLYEGILWSSCVRQMYSITTMGVTLSNKFEVAGLSCFPPR